TFWQRLENHLCFFSRKRGSTRTSMAETADGAAEIASIGPKQRCPRRPCTAPPIGVTTTSSERGTMWAIQRHAAAQLPLHFFFARAVRFVRKWVASHVSGEYRV